MTNKVQIVRCDVWTTYMQLPYLVRTQMTTIWILILKYMGSSKFDIQQIIILPSPILKYISALLGILMPHELVLQQAHKDFLILVLSPP